MAMVDICLFIPLGLVTLCLPWRTLPAAQGFWHTHKQGVAGEVNVNLRGQVVEVPSRSGP